MNKIIVLLFLFTPFVNFGQSTQVVYRDFIKDRLSVDVQFGYEPVTYRDLNTISNQNYLGIRLERFIKMCKVEAILQGNSTSTYVFIRGGIGFNRGGWNFWGYPIGMRAKVGRGYSTPPSLEIGRRHFSLNLWFFEDKFIPSLVVKVPLVTRFRTVKSKI